VIEQINPMPDVFKVLIVDDSRLFRGEVAQVVQAVPGFVVVGSVFNGVKAVEFIQGHAVDLILLDQEMPEMNGLATLAAVMQHNAQAGTRTAVLMVSSHTTAAADVTIKALTGGAFDFVTKPSTAVDGPGAISRLKSDLVAKLKAFAHSRLPHLSAAMSHGSTPLLTPAPSATFDRPGTRHVVRAIVIGASTGGPRALGDVVPPLCGYFPGVPIFIVQHMPAGFTASLAQNLAKQSGRTCVEAKDNQLVELNTIYVAPGGQHLNLRRGGMGIMTGLPDLPPENGCRPAVDVLFRSSADCYGADLLAVILTGMGNDGTAGLVHVKRAGGHVIAQNQATSVVWGMPGSAVAAGVVDEVHPLGDIAVACDLYQRRLVMRNSR